MKKICVSFVILLMFCVRSYGQFTLTIAVTDEETNEPLPGATVSLPDLNRSVFADSVGVATISNLPAASFRVSVTFVDYEEKDTTINVAPESNGSIRISLTRKEDEHEEEVVIQATRTSRSIANTPTRIEVISGEELAEKGNMKPGDIRMLLNESTGIQTQQTSATSYNSSIRIQGLDGRYTQILRDGFPLYAGFSGGLSIMQIAPLDLQQVEVIKGSSSTLYGGGAIAGLVNLVSKVPGETRELSFMANATSAKGLDLSGYYSEKYGRLGLSVFGSRNTASPYDPADIGLTAIPKSERYTIHPRLFFYGDHTTANVGVSYVTENRVGGSMDYIKNGHAGYFEKNITDRVTTQIAISHHLNERSAISLKNSYSRFNRTITIPAYEFSALQQSSFSELTYNYKRERAEWIIGANFLTDDLNERPRNTNFLRSYHYNTYGIFVQNEVAVNDLLTIESGLRGDYVSEFGFEWLPRLSVMLRVSPKLTARVGGGFGYKTPTVFNEEAERLQFQRILPIDAEIAHNERSVGSNVDLNYRTQFGELGFTINQLFFYTRLNRPLILSNDGSAFRFVNANGHIDTKGMETNIRFTYHDFKLFIGYTYADVNTHFNQQKEWFPLTARHRLNNVLMYEKDEKLKIGLEAYYFTPQQLNDGSRGKPYWIMGLMMERVWEKFSLFLNFENFTDTRQTRFDTIYTGPIEDPIFRDIYAPVDGFVANGGIKIRL